MKLAAYIEYIDRSSEDNGNRYKIVGWAFYDSKKIDEYIIKVNGSDVDFKIERYERKDVQKVHSKHKPELMVGVCISFLCKSDNINEIYIGMKQKENIIKIFELKSSRIKKLLRKPEIMYYIDNVVTKSNEDVVVRNVKGWAYLCGIGMETNIFVKNSHGKIIESKIKKYSREDLGVIPEIKDKNICMGFEIEYDTKEDDEIIVFTSTDGYYSKEIGIKDYLKRNAKIYKKFVIKQVVHHVNVRNTAKAVKYVFKHGTKGLKEKILTACVDDPMHYDEWFMRHKATEKELEDQRKTVFEFSPKISILVPTYNTPGKLLKEMVDSVINQTYSNWELCIADGSQGNSELENILNDYAGQDSRIVVKYLDKNLGIAGNTNGALELATGEYIGLLDHDDLLAPNALFEVVKVLQDDSVDIVYTDEDKVTDDLSKHLDPNFKPDFSIDLFRSHNYITHFFVCRKKIIDKIGGFRSEYDGSQDYDLMFRCIENSKVIKHIPMILYHWRVCVGSVAENPASKMYAYDAGERAIQDHLNRVGIKGHVEQVGLWGMYRVFYDVVDDPMVSIIIPNKDHINDLDICINSLINVNEYRNIEIIIVENNSEERKTFEYYDSITRKYNFIKVIYWDGIFNYSAINNFGVKEATGDYILLLNNDTEIIAKDAIKDMLGICMRGDVGIVGAKLYYADDTVQHAGIVIGFGGYAGHVFSGISKKDYGYMIRARITCNYSAVTAACLMTPKRVFEEVGGLDEIFVVACNDVDYCLRVREKGYLVVYDAFAEWYHYESKSRGYEDTPEKKQRFENEVGKFRDRWGKLLEEGDPYYNKNFPVTLAPFTLD